MSIAELGVIEAVINTSQNDIPLPVKQLGTLVNAYGDLAATGCSWTYYVAWPSGFIRWRPTQHSGHDLGAVLEG